jgi:hypothetical protein
MVVEEATVEQETVQAKVGSEEVAYSARRLAG